MLRKLALAALTAAHLPSAHAAEADPAASTASGDSGYVIGAEPSNWSLGIAFGYGNRSNPLIQSDDIPIVVDVDIAWFGEHFFFDNGDLGLTVSDNEYFTLNLIGRLRSDRVFFGRTDTRFVRFTTTSGDAVSVPVVVPDRDYAIEAGAEILAGGAWGRLQLAAFGDVSGTHDGYELGADYSIGFRSNRWYFEPSLGVAVKSEGLNDYYWGVRPEESSSALPAYAAGPGANVSLRALVSYQLTTDWAVSLVAEYERLNADAADSPLVRDDHVTGFFAGFGYRF